MGLSAGCGGVGPRGVLGLRDAESAKAKRMFAAIGPTARTGSCNGGRGRHFGDVILIAVPWEATQEVVEPIAPQLAGKVLIDCTNPIKPDLSGLLRWSHHVGRRGDRSVGAVGPRGEGIQHGRRGHFATTRSTATIRPRSLSVATTTRPRKLSRSWPTEIGFEVIDAGPLSKAHYLEPLAMLWIHLAIRGKFGSKIAVKLLRR